VDAKKRRKLEAEGWRIGDAADFLELTPEEAEFVQLAADPFVSVDLLVRSLLKLGARRGDVAKLVTRKGRRTSGSTA